MSQNEVIRLYTCGSCSKTREIKMSMEQHNELDEPNRERNIQEIIPHVSNDDRELMISGICGECFEKLFA